MFCRNCGKELFDEAVVCMYCGVKTDNFEKAMSDSAQTIEPEVVQDNPVKKALIVGYITAVLIPLVGFILGIYVLFKNRVLHGVGIITISLLMFILYAGL